MSMQILQYEFLGPIPLSEWGPPMGELVYAVLSADKDRFNMLYVGDCEHTDAKSFFVQHEQFKCWIKRAGAESALHLAVFPMKGSGGQKRQTVLRRIISNYRPPCNPADPREAEPSYNVRSAGGPGDGAARETPDGGGGNDPARDGKDAGVAGSAAATADADVTGADANGSGTADAPDDSGTRDAPGAIPCPCCGSDMAREKSVGGNGAASSSLYRCAGCGMSETRID